MPIRYITIPGSVEFKDPITGVPLENNEKPEVLTFETFLGRLMHNPLWGDSYHGMKAQREVLSAWEKAKALTTEPKVMLLAEEDWSRLKQAAEFPKPGLGYHPALSAQLLPMVTAIMEATTTDPTQSADAPEPSTTTQRIKPPLKKPAA